MQVYLINICVPDIDRRRTHAPVILGRVPWTTTTLSYTIEVDIHIFAVTHNLYIAKIETELFPPIIL